MEQTVTEIADVSSREVTTPRGPGTVYEVRSTDSTRYSTFDRDTAVAAAAAKGQRVLLTFTVTEKTKGNQTYKNYNLHGVQTTDIPSVNGNTDAATVDIPTQQPQGDRELSIARAVALKAAVDTVAVLQVDTNSSGILAIADTYVKWLLTGEFEQKQSNDDGIPFGADTDI